MTAELTPAYRWVMRAAGPDREGMGPHGGPGPRGPACHRARPARGQPRLLLGSGGDRRRGGRRAPDPRPGQEDPVEDQARRAGPRRHGPDPDRPGPGDAARWTPPSTGCAEGHCIGVFPEGTRSLGRTLRARSGLGRLAEAVPEAEIVCVRVTGTTDITAIPKRPAIRAEVLPAGGGGLQPGESPAGFGQRVLDELRAGAPRTPPGRKAPRRPEPEGGRGAAATLAAWPTATRMPGSSSSRSWPPRRMPWPSRSPRSARPTSSWTSGPRTGSRSSSSSPCRRPTAGPGARTPSSPMRHDLPTRAFAPASQGHPSQGVKGFVDGAVRPSRRRTAGSRPCRTRCCRSSSATRSCGPACPRSGASSATCPAAPASSGARFGREDGLRRRRPPGLQPHVVARVLEHRAEPVDDLVQHARVADERRGDLHHAVPAVVAAGDQPGVAHAPGQVAADQPVALGLLEAGAVRVRHELDGPEEAAAADVPHDRQRAELVQAAGEVALETPHVVEHAIALEELDAAQRDRRAQRVPGERQAVAQDAAARVQQRLGHAVGDHDGAHRRVGGRQPLGGRGHVGHDALALDSQPLPQPTEAARSTSSATSSAPHSSAIARRPAQ